MTSSPTVNYVLRSDAAGNATWVNPNTLVTGLLPTGTSAQTLRHDGTNWVANSVLVNNGTNVGIGTTSPDYKLHVSGSDFLTLKLAAPANPLLKLSGSYNSGNGAEFWQDNLGDARLNINGAINAIYMKATGDIGLGISFPSVPAARLDVNNGTSTVPIFLARDNGTEVMRIDDGGNVGIGTTAPGAKLHVQNTTNGTIGRFNTTATGWGGIQVETGTGGVPYLLFTSGANSAVVKEINGGMNLDAPDNTTRIRIQASDGNVGIGTTAPGAKLEVAGQVKITGGTPGAGKVLTSDAAGLATWTTPTSGTVTSVTADNGLTQGGTANAPTIKLGGPLTANTTVTQDNAEVLTLANNGTGNTVINLQSTGDFDVQDNGTSAFFVRDDGYVGIGTTAPGAYLDITGSNAGTTSLQLRSGNTNSGTTSNQIVMGYSGAETYRHAIKTRHNSGGTANNAIDFYVWKYGTDAIGTVGTQQVMTIDGGNGGSVGIGTTTPANILAVHTNVNASNGISIKNQNSGTSAQSFVLAENSSGDAIYLGMTSPNYPVSPFTLGQGYISSTNAQGIVIWPNHPSAPINFHAGASITPHMTIASSGNVGIGTTAPGYILTVNGQPAANGYTAFTNYSDARLKTNVAELESSLTKIMALRPVEYNYNQSYLKLYNDPTALTKVHKGFIAQEIKEVFPEMVGEVNIQGTDYYDLNLSNLQIYMVKAMQEQQQIIEQQKSEIIALKNLNVASSSKINTMQAQIDMITEHLNMKTEK